jgi:plasmid replication initiation protein
MPEETTTLALTEEVITPQTKGGLPYFVLQHNAVSRSVQNLSATAKKLTTMAMALLPTDFSSLTVAFTFTEFCKALGMEEGGEQYKLFKSAVDECMKCVISIEIPTGKIRRGKELKIWEKFTWFTYSKFDENTGHAVMEFSEKLASYLRSIQWLYSKIFIKKIGQLQSFYAIRIFELVTSYASLAGMGGNKADEWYVDIHLPEDRLMLGVPEGAYPEIKRLRQFVINEPVKSINGIDAGIEITIESIKQGRRVIGYRLNCKKAAESKLAAPAKKRGRKKKEEAAAADAGGGAAVPARAEQADDMNLKDKDLHRLKELYPKEFAELYEAKFAELSHMPRSATFQKARSKSSEYHALEELRKKYGIAR